MEAHIVAYLRPFYKCQQLGKSKENDFLVYHSRDEGHTGPQGVGMVLQEAVPTPPSSSSPRICNWSVITLNLISGLATLHCSNLSFLKKCSYC